jgi:hypothetical protein
MTIDNHSYLVEDSPLFFTHCFACQHDLLIEKETVMKGMSNVVKFYVAREEMLIENIDKRHVHKRPVGRRVFVRPATMNRKEDKGSSVNEVNYTTKGEHHENRTKESY